MHGPVGGRLLERLTRRVYLNRQGRTPRPTLCFPGAARATFGDTLFVTPRAFPAKGLFYLEVRRPGPKGGRDAEEASASSGRMAHSRKFKKNNLVNHSGLQGSTPSGGAPPFWEPP
jgi:hypothetical protein